MTGTDKKGVKEGKVLLAAKHETVDTGEHVCEIVF